MYDTEKKTAQGVFEKFRIQQSHMALIDVVEIFEEHILEKYKGNPFSKPWLDVAKEQRAKIKANIDSMFAILGC